MALRHRNWCFHFSAILERIYSGTCLPTLISRTVAASGLTEAAHKLDAAVAAVAVAAVTIAIAAPTPAGRSLATSANPWAAGKVARRPR